ncbi:magnesium-dependent phosphatase-1 [Sulfuracidifex tepidarius]|uniref:Phosphoglycolate phosphatase n=1 Tax=Sulfuracidifex tepidarius TaxID=1294262 RepID=A0A510E2M0_9CREN|nr:magnesium-dependent phosphatase-1 [Sulfuracidifex tepidarius]BBG24000.1 Phosphoglycolate phosphatase [Sulfuracidifex tepidarius]BBG26755.1 Phosphoglycolate phosphatase [Sulfuracidifex tepidarius]
MAKVVVFDADKTLWDHYNISEFVEPLKRISTDEVEDSTGNKLKLFPHVRSSLQELKRRGFITGMATWNLPEKTSQVLRTLELQDFFDVIISRPFPYKFIMLGDILIELRRRGLNVRREEVVFVDDRRIHFGNVWLYLPGIQCMEMWHDIQDHMDMFKILEQED